MEKNLKSILQEVLDQDLIDESTSFDELYSICKELGYEDSEKQFVGEFLDLLQEGLSSTVLLRESELGRVAGGKGNVSKKMDAMGLALSGPVIGMDSQVGAAFDAISAGDKLRTVSSISKIGSKAKDMASDVVSKADGFISKNPGKSIAGATTSTFLLTSLAAVGYDKLRTIVGDNDINKFVLGKIEWNEIDTQDFLASYDKLDGILNKSDGRLNDEQQLVAVKKFFNDHNNQTPFVRMFEAVSKNNIDQLKNLAQKENDADNIQDQIMELNVQDDDIDKRLRELENQMMPNNEKERTKLNEEHNQLNGKKANLKKEIAELEKRKVKSEKERITRVKRLWNSAKEYLKKAVKEAIKDSTLSVRLVDLAVGLQINGLLDTNDLSGDKVHKNFEYLNRFGQNDRRNLSKSYSTAVENMMMLNSIVGSKSDNISDIYKTVNKLAGASEAAVLFMENEKINYWDKQNWLRKKNMYVKLIYKTIDLLANSCFQVDDNFGKPYIKLREMIGVNDVVVGNFASSLQIFLKNHKSDILSTGNGQLLKNKLFFCFRNGNDDLVNKDLMNDINYNKSLFVSKSNIENKQKMKAIYSLVNAVNLLDAKYSA